MEFQSRKKIIGKIQNCSFKWAVQASHEIAIHEQKLIVNYKIAQPFSARLVAQYKSREEVKMFLV